MKTLLMYMPVVHAGYLKLISELRPDCIFIVSDEIAEKYDKRRKDIRAIHSSECVALLRTLFSDRYIAEFNGSHLPQGSIHMPIEDISDDILKDYLHGRNVVWESVFLRYDSKKSKEHEEIIPDRIVFEDHPDIAPIVALLQKERVKSPDCWRQVSASVVKNGKVLSLCCNKHVPSDAVTGALGDPRSNSQKGLATNVSKAAHAEPIACFLAGVEGCCGASLFSSTFPCPQCANFISFTKLRNLYYMEGYAMLNGVQDLHAAGIEIVKIVKK